MDSQLIFEAESYNLIGACFEVYREKGCGFLEPVYQECLELELRLPFIPKRPLVQAVRSEPNTSRTLFVTTRSSSNSKRLANWPMNTAQNYLKATGLKLGLLINFGHYPKVQIERIVSQLGRYNHSR